MICGIYTNKGDLIVCSSFSLTIIFSLDFLRFALLLSSFYFVTEQDGLCETLRSTECSNILLKFHQKFSFFSDRESSFDYQFCEAQIQVVFLETLITTFFNMKGKFQTPHFYVTIIDVKLYAFSIILLYKTYFVEPKIEQEQSVTKKISLNKHIFLFSLLTHIDGISKLKIQVVGRRSQSNQVEKNVAVLKNIFFMVFSQITVFFSF